MLFLTIKGKNQFYSDGEDIVRRTEVRFRNMFKKAIDFVSINSLFITQQCGDGIDSGV
jgi:hypothetical protein